MRPTAKQLAYLRSLAQRTGETFTYPSTSAEASREISRLTGRPRSSRSDIAQDRRAVADAMAEHPDDSTRVRADEVSGHGSSARWAGDPPHRRLPVVGPKVELARYRTSTEERIVFGQRVDGVARVIDKPAATNGRSFLVERGLSSKSELEALVRDYVAQSVDRDEPAVLVDLDELARDREASHA
jgi:hypothetical protein